VTTDREPFGARVAASKVMMESGAFMRSRRRSRIAVAVRPCAAAASLVLSSCSGAGSIGPGSGPDSGGGGTGNSSGSNACSGNGSSGSGSASGGAGGTDASDMGDSVGSGSSSGSGAGGSGSSSGNGAGGSGASGSGSSGAADGGANCGGSVLGGGPTLTTTAHLDIGAHDPSMIWDGTRYYLFATGGTLGVRSSTNIQNWSGAGNVLNSVPGWVATATSATDLWAPDISYFNGSFHVYYAGSTFGSNNSVIGLSTTKTLQSPNWIDQGLVLQSKTSDNFNAIDPSVSFDQNCTPWLAFGSFWSGIKLRKLDSATGKLATDDTTLYSLASRPKNGGAIEASSIVSHNGYYYLFASFDACCKGVNSTYNTNVGRATKITGPYTNKAGTDMMQGGADQLLASSGRYIGPGGGTAWKDGNTYLYVYHYYDGQDNGNAKLQIRPINFDANDWVTLGNPLFP
jgi:arabinan endo-1,5-alpha-L-arabinosidase